MDYLMYEGEDQESALIRKEEMALVRHNIAGALAKLSEKESFIIRNRVMADTHSPSRRSATAITSPREGRQIEKQALRKLGLAIPYLARKPN